MSSTGTARLFGLVLQQIHPIRADRDAIRVSARKMKQRRPIEVIEAMNRIAIAAPQRGIREGVGEQQHHDGANQPHGEHGEENRPIDDGDTAVEHAKVADDPVMLLASAREKTGLEFLERSTIRAIRKAQTFRNAADSGEEEDGATAVWMISAT